MNVRSIHIAALAIAAAAAAAAQPFASAAIEPAAARKGAPDFELRDSAGKTAKLRDYRGKIVLLDFWATWCTGCKQEIPWFAGFQQKFGANRLAVVGVSLAEGGWPVLKPFLSSHPVPYRILLGDHDTAKHYGIEGMPDTFLIDRQGRIAAAYRGALVDRVNLEKNIAALLAAP